MKTLMTGLLSLLVLNTLLACNTPTNEKAETTVADGDKIEIYYFHFSKRCATCNAVENETLATLEKLYAEKVSDGVISFTSLNLDDEGIKEKAKALNVSGQTLLLVKGENQVNLTNDGFMNARNNPEKFQEILKAQIDKLL